MTLAITIDVTDHRRQPPVRRVVKLHQTEDRVKDYEILVDGKPWNPRRAGVARVLAMLRRGLHRTAKREG